MQQKQPKKFLAWKMKAQWIAVQLPDGSIAQLAGAVEYTDCTTAEG